MNIGDVVSRFSHPQRNGKGFKAVMLQPVGVRLRAAKYFLDSEAERLKANIAGGPFGAPDDTQRLEVVKKRYPEVAQMASSGASSVQALKEMYWQHG